MSYSDSPNPIEEQFEAPLEPAPIRKFQPFRGPEIPVEMSPYVALQVKLYQARIVLSPETQMGAEPNPQGVEDMAQILVLARDRDEAKEIAFFWAKEEWPQAYVDAKVIGVTQAMVVRRKGG